MAQSYGVKIVTFRQILWNKIILCHLQINLHAKYGDKKSFYDHGIIFEKRCSQIWI